MSTKSTEFYDAEYNASELIYLYGVATGTEYADDTPESIAARRFYHDLFEGTTTATSRDRAAVEAMLKTVHA